MYINWKTGAYLLSHNYFEKVEIILWSNKEFDITCITIAFQIILQKFEKFYN